MSLRLSFYESLQLVVRFLDTQRRGARGGEARGGEGGVSQVVSAQQCTLFMTNSTAIFSPWGEEAYVKTAKKKKKKNGISTESVWDDSLKVQNDSHFGSVLQNN